jgi:hypothetical protein
MSREILARRDFAADQRAVALAPLPPRLTGSALRRALVGFGGPVPLRLGERVLAGRRLYSAAWLDAVQTQEAGGSDAVV